MGQGTPRNIHVISAGYVRRFTGPRNTVTVHHQQKGVLEKGPRGVGRESDFWGPPDLARELEELFSKTESDGLRLLGNLQQRWPLERSDRVALGLFLTLQIVRLPAYGGVLRLLAEQSNREVMMEEAPKYGLDEEQVAALLERHREPRVHADTLVRHIPRLASALCSMHWSVVAFENDWLMSCDQPVVFLPPGSGQISTASAIPATGFMNTVEVRFVLDPRHALLLTWHDTAEEPWLVGEHAHACSINCALRAQAFQEWFCRPGTTPPFLVPPILEERVSPISVDLLAGYTVDQASGSQRRAAASETIAQLFRDAEQGEQDGQMRWVRVGDAARPAA